MSSRLSGEPWQFPSVFTLPPFLIGNMSHLTGCDLVCHQGAPHTLGHQAKTVQHGEYPKVEVRAVLTFFQAN